MTKIIQHITIIVISLLSLTPADAQGWNCLRKCCLAKTAKTFDCPFAINGVVDSASCNVNDGSIIVGFTGGRAAYNTLWSNGATTNQINGLAPGTYDVTVTDAEGCTTNGNYTVFQEICDNNCDYTIDTEFSGQCSENYVSIDLTITGGTGPFTFLWNTGDTTEDIDTVTTNENSFFVTVTDGAGCETIGTFTFTETCECNPMYLNYQVEEACDRKEGTTVRKTNGAIDITIAGGFPPYAYSWIWLDTATNQIVTNTNEDLTGLLGNTYYHITATDSKGCQLIDSIFLEDKSVLGHFTVQDNYCAGDSLGSITLDSITNGDGYSIVWNTGDTTANLENLILNNYIYTLNNNYGCRQFFGYNVLEPNPLIINAVVNNSTCNTSGNIDITATEGTAPYTFIWENGLTTEDRNNLGAGTYLVTVVDANGCQKEESFTLTGTFEATCGAIQVQVTGGSGSFTYAWSNLDNTANIPNGFHTVTITDTNDGCQQILMCGNCPTAVGTACDDGDSCTEDDKIQPNCECKGMPIKNEQGQTCDDGNANTYNDQYNCDANCDCNCEGMTCAISVGLTAFADCATNTATIQANVSGSIYAPFTYAWSNGPTTQNQTGLPFTGNYTVTVTDAVGCTTIENIAVDVNCDIEEFCELHLADAGGKDGYNESFIAANNGQAVVQAGPYDLPDEVEIKVNGVTVISICHSNLGWPYDYCTSAPTDFGRMPQPEFFTWQAGDQIEIIVTPNCGVGCNEGGVTIWDLGIICVSDPNQLAVDITISCEDLWHHRPIRVIATGGTAPYNFEWLSGPQMGSTWTFDPSQPINPNSSGNALNAWAGCDSSDRTIRVTDSKQNTVIQTITSVNMPCRNHPDWGGWVECN